MLCIAISLVGTMIMNSCHEVDDDRIPQMPVNINLGDAGIWNVYGVSGFGLSRNFIMGVSPSQPEGFHYSADSRTGYGGVLLIGGMDPYSVSENPNIVKNSTKPE